MEIVPFADEHLAGVIALARAEGWGFYDGDHDRARAALTASGVTTVVALEDGAVVGFAQLQSDGTVQAHLTNVAVDPGHRRTGIGRRLLEQALTRAGGQRIDLVSTEAGERFYASFPHFRMPGYRLYPFITDQHLAELPPEILLGADDLMSAAEASRAALEPPWTPTGASPPGICAGTADAPSITSPTRCSSTPRTWRPARRVGFVHSGTGIRKPAPRPRSRP